MEKGYIYKITNPQDYIYIGQTYNIERRKKNYINTERIKGQRLIYNSIKKYGWENHIFEIIEEINIENNNDTLILEKLEINWIEKLELNRNKYPKGNGLNLTDGGKTTKGMKHSEETIEKLRVMNTGRKHSEESKMKDRLNNLGKHNHPSKYKGISRTQEIKNKISKTHIGMSHTEETKKKLSKILKGKIACNRVKINVYDYKTGEYINTYDSYIECGKELKINNNHISSVLSGKRNHCGGYTFKKVNYNKLKIKNKMNMENINELSENEKLLNELFEDENDTEIKRYPIMVFDNKYTDEEKKKNGVFYTPQDISKLMSNKTKLFDDGKGIWLDPCCGLGVLSINLASIQDDPVNFITNRLIINDKDKFQLEIALNNFKEKFGVVPKSFNEDFLEYDFQCDYIIMNPPYFKYKDNDIYAYFLDKSSKITKGFISINPISFTNGSKFNKIRENILKFNSITLYHFDSIPGHIFDDADVRVSIIMVHNSSNERKTTGLIRWQSKKRNEMLINIDNNLDKGIFTKDIFYKTAPKTSYLIHDNKLSNYIVKKSDYPIYVTNTPRYFIAASSKKLDRTGQIEIFMKDEDTYNKALIMLNSSYLYWWWRTSDSSLSLTKTTLLSLPWIDFYYDKEIINKIKLSENNNKVYKKNAGKLQENIKHPKELVILLNSLFVSESLIKLHD